MDINIILACIGLLIIIKWVFIIICEISNYFFRKKYGIKEYRPLWMRIWEDYLNFK